MTATISSPSIKMLATQVATRITKTFITSPYGGAIIKFDMDGYYFDYISSPYPINMTFRIGDVYFT